MKFRQRVCVFLLGKVKYLLELHRVSAFLAGLPCICSLAQLAVDDADVGVVDVAIDVVIDTVAIQALTRDIGQPAEHENVVRMIEVGAFFKG